MRIHRYILKEIMPIFSIGIMVSSSILVIFQILRLSEMIFAYGASLKTVFITFVLLIPPFFNITIPISVLLAVILAFARLSSDEEYTAMNASGMSLRNLYPAVFVFGLSCFLFTLASTCYLEPWSKKYINGYLTEAGKSKVALVLKSKLKEGTFIADFFGQILYVNKLSEQNSKLEEVFLATQSTKEVSYTLAKRGRIIQDKEKNIAILSLEDGVFHAPQKGENSEIMHFKRADINLVRLFENSIKIKKRRIDYEYQSMYIDELIYNIEQRANRGEINKHYYRVIFLLHQKLSLPFACLLFAFLGMPLGITNPRSGKSRGYVVGLTIILFYYIIMMVSKSLTEQGKLDPIWAAWAPNIVFLAFSSWFFYYRSEKMSLENPFLKYIEWVKKIFERLIK